MRARIKLIPLALAQSDMVLGDAIFDAQGRVLLQAEIVLDDNILKRLHRHQVICVPIKELDNRTDEQLEQLRIETTERINQLFDIPQKSMELEELHRLVLEYRLESLL